MRSLGSFTLAMGAATALAAPAHAEGWSLETAADLRLRPVQPDAAAAPEDDQQAPEWTDWTQWAVAFEPVFWYPGIDGDIQVAGSTAAPDIEDLELDDNDATPAFEAMLRSGPHTVRVSGFIFEESDSETARLPVDIGAVSLNTGDAFSGEIDYSAFEATYGHRIWDKTFRAEGDPVVHLRLNAYGGFRIYDLELSVTPLGGQGLSEDETWVDLIGGLRLEAEFTEEFSFDLAVDAGGFAIDDEESTSVNIVTGFQWRPRPNIGAQIGWRFLFADFNDGEGGDQEFDFSGSIAGLYAGVVLRF